MVVNKLIAESTEIEEGKLKTINPNMHAKFIEAFSWDSEPFPTKGNDAGVY